MEATRRLYIETYGCQMNVADSEVVARIMQMGGYTLCETLDNADVVVLNTCSVRDNAEQRVLNRLQYLHALKRKRHRFVVGVIGCMAERMQQTLIDEHGVDVVAGPDAYMDLPALIETARQGHQAINIEMSGQETYRDIIPARIGNPISGYVSIMRGCDNFCSYCIVPYTRGRERSRDVDSILAELSDLRQRGYKEVTLLGQNVNSYRFTATDGTEYDFRPITTNRGKGTGRMIWEDFDQPLRSTDRDMMYALQHAENVQLVLHGEGGMNHVKTLTENQIRDFYRTVRLYRLKGGDLND